MPLNWFSMPSNGVKLENQVDFLSLKGFYKEGMELRQPLNCLVFAGRIFLAGWLLSPIALGAGDPIIFSDGPEPAKLPEDFFQQQMLNRIQSQFNQSELSTAPAAPPPASLPPQSSSILQQRLMELHDRQKNWLFQNPENYDREEAIDKALGIADRSSPTMFNRQRSSYERHMEGAEDRESDRPGRSENSRFERGADSPRDGDPEFNSFHRAEDRYGAFRQEVRSGTVPGLSAVLPGSLPALPQLGALQNPSLFDSSLNRSFANPKANAPDTLSEAVKGSSWQTFDPNSQALNMQLDPTRQELNPIVGQRLPVFSPSASSSALPDFSPGASLPGLGVRGEFSTAFPRVTTDAPNLSIPAAPPSRPTIQPRPGVLEFPRRAF